MGPSSERENTSAGEAGQVKKEKEDLAKEVEQAMIIRIKASKNIKQLMEGRNSALHEYSVIMGGGKVNREKPCLEGRFPLSLGYISFSRSSDNHFPSCMPTVLQPYYLNLINYVGDESWV